ncbi:MAG: Tad domain-containing protein [Planctomycetes bacterium]|nr:Tad domain-containing protein [Planctomycetota bacterium]
MLVLFALLAFVFFAVAGLAIDIGLANLTQAQMQSAVDSAAIEGCRWRNFDETIGDSHAEKRRKTSAMVRLAFDDDLHPTQGGYVPGNGTAFLPADDADAAQLGAGPALRVSGGVGAWNANAVVGAQPDAELARIDDPRLQPNIQNRPQGDIVVGTFDPDEPGREQSSYQRRDFTPAVSGTQRVNALSVLVRMRRAGDGNPDDVQPGVSSSLPTLPFVFGLGSTMLRAPGESWDPRRDGLTVRATAIASARPAMRVGRPPCDEAGAPLYDHEPSVGGTFRERISGVVPFFVYLDAWAAHFRGPGWQASSSSTMSRVRVEPDGRLVLDTDGATVGHFLFDATSAPANPCDPEVGWPVAVGRAVPRATSTPVRPFRFTTRKPAYIPIVENVPDANGVPVLRVVGYGFAHLWPVGFVPDGSTPPPSDFGGTGTFVISAGELINHFGVTCWVAQDNASAVPSTAIDQDVGLSLSAAEWNAVLRWSNVFAYGTETPDPARMHDYTYIQRGTVLAPALTR